MQHSFVQETILPMAPAAFERLKAALLGEYIQVRMVAPENVSKEVLAEKIYDHFDKIHYKTGKKFEDLLKNYMTVLDSLVEPHVAKTPQAKKNEPTPITPRSRKYYDKAIEIKKALNGLSELTDYSRLMLCLYAAIINSGEDKISTLDFGLTCLKPDVIIDALKTEKESALFGRKNPKPRFDTSDPYATDSSFFVIAIIMLYAIIGDSLVEDLDNE